jgi:uncharacterized protein (TIGR04255 family)
VSDREVYPNAPIVLVAAEVRHPAADPLSPAQQAVLKRTLAEHLPLSNPATMTNVTTLGGAPPTMQQSVSPRFTSRDRTTSVTFHAGALVVETTRYGQFERLMELLTLAVDARLSLGGLDGLERVGLRYIDEIRVPESSEAGSADAASLGVGSGPGVEWAEWVAASLLGPAPVAASLGLRASQWQGITVFGPPETVPDTLTAPGPVDMLPNSSWTFEGEDSLVLRYGLANGYAVDPGGELKRSVPPPGPFFLLDIDSSWTSAPEVPPMDRDELVRIAARLHTPVRDLFEALITDRLREEILRHAR